MSAITESRSGQRTFSARIIDVSIGSRRMVASPITPVRPSAPAVPQKSSGSVSGGDGDRALRRVERERLDVVGEAAVEVVALAVHVGGDRAADGDLSSARRDVHEPAERDHRAHDRLEAHAGVDPHDAPLEVDVVEAGERGRVEHGAAGVLRSVAVAAAEAARDQAATPGPGEPRVDRRLVAAARRPSRPSARCGSSR